MPRSGIAQTDAQLARALAEEAGRRLVELRQGDGAGLEPAELKARGDATAQAYLAQALAETRPDDAVLSEEAADDLARLDADRVWIVDPLDGTREFSEAGRHDWAVHVALWERGELTAGAVALPALGRVLGTDDPAPLPDGDARVRLAVSRTRASATVLALAEELGAELVPLGSAGYKTLAVLLGEVDAYVHTGGQYEWDSAAPVAVARASGLHTSRVDGSPLLYNRRDPLLPDLVVCRPELAEPLLTALKPLLDAPPANAAAAGQTTETPA